MQVDSQLVSIAGLAIFVVITICLGLEDDMKLLLITSISCLAIGMVAGPAFAISPLFSEPLTQPAKNGLCIPGTASCSMMENCTLAGEVCVACPTGYQPSSVGMCYMCPEGTSLKSADDCE